VPYYNRVLKERSLTPGDIATVDDLHKLPILDKGSIRNNFPDKIVARNVRKGELMPSRTAGSTGEPLHFYVDRRSRSFCRAAFYRFLKWMGIEIGDTIAQIWAGPELNKTKGRIVSELKKSMLRIVTLNALKMDERHLATYAEKLAKLKPKLLYGYPSSMYILAEYMDKIGAKVEHDLAVSTTAEVLPNHQRDFIESFFHCRIFDLYGCGELNSIACECEKHGGLHIATEHVIVEIIPEDGSRSNAESGLVVITDLENYGMPFIRYANGDRSLLLKESCTCGRGLPLMASIEGRIYDVIRGLNGNTIYGGFIHKILFGQLDWISRFGIRQYQVIQETDRDLTVKIVSDIRPPRNDEEQLTPIIHRYLGRMNVRIQYVEGISPGESGKTRFVISKIN